MTVSSGLTESQAAAIPPPKYLWRGESITVFTESDIPAKISVNGDASSAPPIDFPYVWSRRPYIRTVSRYGAIGDNIKHTLAEIFNTLAQAQVVYPHATALTDLIDWAAIQAAINDCRVRGVPGFVEFSEEGRYRIEKPLVFNPTLDCNTLVSGITLIAPGGHRAYDSGTDMPVSITSSGTLPSIFDGRAAQKLKIKGLGIYAFGTVDKVIRLGAEDCANPASIVRVATIEDCLVYGGSRAVDAYLTSGLRIKGCNISRSASRGASLNACGDYSITETFFNNIGPMVQADLVTDGQNSGLGSDFYDGCGIVAYGGGGNNRIWGDCRFEVMNKGILLDSVQGYQIFGNFIDKCREFGLGVSANTTITGNTNLAYQPRSISVFGNRFGFNGWSSTYNSHVYLRNGGTNVNLELTLSANTFARGGPNAIDLLPDVYSTQADIFGVGPFRSIRCSNLSLGTSTISIQSSGNSYSGGSSDYTIDAVSGQDQNIHFSQAADSMDKPIGPTILAS